ncbi:MAG: serine/threonine protein kinase [Planctomycetota bacterium]|nr:MAG: serine/threonine protein kinase [Planctomycetota bacterium]
MDTDAAQVLARAVVKHRLLDREVARKAFQDYWLAAQEGPVAGGFRGWLVRGGLVPPEALERLEVGAPEPSAASGWGSAVVRDPRTGDGSRGDGAREDGARGDGSRSEAAPPLPDGSPSLLADPAAPADVVRTQAFPAVLPTSPSPAEPASAGPETSPARMAKNFQSTAPEAPSPPPLDFAPDPLERQEAEFFRDAESAEGISLPQDDPEGARLPQVGELLGDYRVVGELGRGAMGVIYRAEHVTRGETVALKVLVGLDGPGARKRRQRFQREVEALRRLQHENIVRIHTCGRRGRLDWYVMDYVEGRELKALLADPEGPTPRERLQLFEGICAAVAHAHERGVVHRDLKPANVLVDADGGVHVLDFGLAKLAAEEEDERNAMELTKTNATLGTPYYMAPEQFTNAKGVDWRADVYSLGVVLFELMCGRRPFEAETAGELIQKVLTEAPPLPSSVNPKLSPKFDAICMRALDKDRERRYQQVEDLRLAVASYRRGAHGSSEIEVALERLRRWLSDHRVPVLVGATLASLFWLPLVFLAYWL